jgi:hypothetical protein
VVKKIRNLARAWPDSKYEHRSKNADCHRHELGTKDINEIDLFGIKIQLSCLISGFIHNEFRSWEQLFDRISRNIPIRKKELES